MTNNNSNQIHLMDDQRNIGIDISPQFVRIKSIGKITHDVLQIVTSKPVSFEFIPGQAVDISIHKNGWRNQLRPFTFTSLPEQDHLQFTIKTYPEREGVTNELLQLQISEELILHEVFGAIEYKGEGTFIAGGAGVTPFIGILRYLHSKNLLGNNKLIFANKYRADIILEQEFINLLGKNFINILSEEKTIGYAYGLITKDFLQKNIKALNQMVYLCGPLLMMDMIEKQLANLQVDKQLIVKESL